MGLIYADLQLTNADDLAAVRRGFMKKDDVRTLGVKALVDTGAYMTALPEHVATQLELPVVEHREFNLADGTAEKLPVVGPVLVEFGNRRTVCFAAATKDSESLLGSIPMEDLDVILNPKKQTIEINPESPYLPRMKMK